MIRVEIPYHLRTLARIDGELSLDVLGQVTLRSVIDAIEARYPMLKGTIRDHGKSERRPMLRFFVCLEDWSNESMDRELPMEILEGKQSVLIIGAIAGG